MAGTVSEVQHYVSTAVDNDRGSRVRSKEYSALLTPSPVFGLRHVDQQCVPTTLGAMYLLHANPLMRRPGAAQQVAIAFGTYGLQLRFLYHLPYPLRVLE